MSKRVLVTTLCWIVLLPTGESMGRAMVGLLQEKKASAGLKRQYAKFAILSKAQEGIVLELAHKRPESELFDIGVSTEGKQLTIVELLRAAF